jgi:hypothetical protein
VTSGGIQATKAREKQGEGIVKDDLAAVDGSDSEDDRLNINNGENGEG